MVQMSQSPVFVNIALFTFLNYICIANEIDCKVEQCQHKTIDCLPNEDCLIQCDETESCMNTTINCPLNSGNCDILCRGGQSCRHATINATLSNGNFNLTCLESTDHCRDIKIYGSITTDTKADYSITCNGNVRACVDAQIICPVNGNCSLFCNDDASCRYAQVTGPNNGDLNIECTGVKSCFDAIFDGSQSSLLDIAGCTREESCFDLSLYCPPNRNGKPNCFIEGNNNLGRDNAKGTKIYAINGWNDISIEYNGAFGALHEGTMFCGDDYGIQCAIATDDWTCANDNDFCNFNPTNPPQYTTQIMQTTKTILSVLNVTNDMEVILNNTAQTSSLGIKIVVSIAVVTIICGSILALKMFQKRFVTKSSKKTEGENSDSFGFILNVNRDSDNRDFVSTENERIDVDIDDTEIENLTVTEPGMKQYKNSINDPLDLTYQYTTPLQTRNNSMTDPTFMSAAISELESPNCMPQANRFSIDMGTQSHKLSEISIGKTRAMTYNHNAPIKETYVTPRPPQRQSGANNEVSSVISSVTTIDSENITKFQPNERSEFSEISNLRKPTEEL